MNALTVTHPWNEARNRAGEAKSSTDPLEGVGAILCVAVKVINHLIDLQAGDQGFTPQRLVQPTKLELHFLGSREYPVCCLWPQTHRVRTINVVEMLSAGKLMTRLAFLLPNDGAVIGFGLAPTGLRVEDKLFEVF